MVRKQLQKDNTLKTDFKKSIKTLSINFINIKKKFAAYGWPISKQLIQA